MREVSNGEIVGFAALKINRRKGELIRAGVHPKHRGRGLQSRLIQARLKRAAEVGLREVHTYTVTDNPASSNNLIEAGFRMTTRPRGCPEYPRTCYWNINL